MMGTEVSQNSETAPKSVLVLKRIFLVGIVLNLVYLTVEAVMGFVFHSSGLLSDAVQNLCDVAGMVMVLLAYKLADPGGTYRFDYGYKRMAMVMSMMVALVVGILVVFVVQGAYRQLENPYPINGKVVAIVASVGVLVNSVTALLFYKSYNRRMKRGRAFRHMVADALVSFAVLVSGVLMIYCKWYLIDAVLGLAIVLITIFAFGELMRHCVRAVLDGVPIEVQYEKIVQSFYGVDGVADVHHLHVWSVGKGENVLSAKVMVQDMSRTEQIRDLLRDRLLQIDISDVTLEFEPQPSDIPEL